MGAPPPGAVVTAATDLIAAERDRQMTEEGYDAEHDAGHAVDLVYASTAYAIEAATVADLQSTGAEPLGDYLGIIPQWWPWSSQYWKPTGEPVRDLVKAGALIAAAIDALLPVDEEAGS